MLTPDLPVIGIDVSKAWLDVAAAGAGTVMRHANTASGIAAPVVDLLAPAPG